MFCIQGFSFQFLVYHSNELLILFLGLYNDTVCSSLYTPWRYKYKNELDIRLLYSRESEPKDSRCKVVFFFTQVNFGCILNDTEVIQSVLVTNNSPMDVKYHWSFVDSDLHIEEFVTRNG